MRVWRARSVAFWAVVLTWPTMQGCSRRYYRVNADRDVAAIYAQKRCEEAYTIPPLPGIEVDPRSRFYDPSPPDCPALPDPQPRLYDYVLPELVTGDPKDAPTIPARRDAVVEGDPSKSGTSEIGKLETAGSRASGPSPVFVKQISSISEANVEPPRPVVLPSSHEVMLTAPSESDDPDDSPEVWETDSYADSEVLDFGELLARSAVGSDAADDSDLPPQPEILPAGEESFDPPLNDKAGRTDSSSNALRIVPIPQEFWSQLPETCVPRMLEFESVQEEFFRSFEQAGPQAIEELLSDAARLTLPNILELATINSREYQSRKETLYRVALRLTAERYEYELRPLRRGNGTSLDYTHVRTGGITVNGLGIPSQVAVTKTTATAGQFLASFANDVVLTFNGPQGFNANVGSRLLFDFQQTLFQRDVVFENLTQAERDVVYAARDLVRFRRALFVDLSDRYYNLLLTYRAIEISSQDYFSNLRAFLQGRAEYLQAGRIPRVQVDQFEQNALRSRSDLVEDCNRLETSLDRLKLTIGLPPEMPLNINLGELESLTISDELTVTRQLVRRTKQSLLDASVGRRSDRDAAVNGASVLMGRLSEALRVRREIEGSQEESQDEIEVARLGKKLALLESRLQTDQLNAIRNREQNSDLPPAELIQFARTIDLIESQLIQVQRALEYREILATEQELADPELNDPTDRLPPDVEPDMRRHDQTRLAQQTALAELTEDWESAIEKRELERLPDLVTAAGELFDVVEHSSAEAIGDLLPKQDRELENVIVDVVAQAIRLVDQVETQEVGGLGEVDVQADQAMLTALTQRLELMNQRGDLADARRQIKLAADDLRSIIDIRATHILRTRSNVNRGFDFTFDDSETRLSLALDTPLNRRIERNNYRFALIDYNAARRSLIDQEDGIKFDIREDLRQLRLRRNQYEIAVASAALAYERVVSTRLQLQLAVGNVVARDFLEAQQAYTAALNSVAREHISFILGRIDLFFDTESIRLNSNGYWDGISDEQLELPATPDFFDANPNPYGRLPACLHYSDEVRCMH